MAEQDQERQFEEFTKQLKLPALLGQPAGQLLEQFGAGKAAPGSGSAAALMGLLAVKLMQTVCTISIRLMPARTSVFDFIQERSALAEPKLRSLFQDDADVFDEVIALRQLRDLENEPAARARLTRQANKKLELATEYSLDIADMCLDLLPHAIDLYKQGAARVRGDSGAAISSAVAGITSALFISNLNVKSLAKRRTGSLFKARADGQFDRLQSLQQDVFACLTAINEEATTALRDDLQLSLDLSGPGQALTQQ